MASARRAARIVQLLLTAAGLARAQIRVLSPSHLVRELGDHGRITGSTATFGAPFFDERILGHLAYSESSKPSAPHCTSTDYDLDFCKRNETFKSENNLNIVVVRRGGCSFVTKVRAAVQKCAHAVIIVDKADSSFAGEDLQHVIVADDGYGSEITLPSVLVSNEKGSKLIDVVQNERVVAELNWGIPQGTPVHVDMWISSASRESLRFLHDFAPKRRTLNSLMSFTPHYTVFGMRAGDPGTFKDLRWDAHGQYCAEDPDGAGPIIGRAVLEEDLRQLCIHEHYKGRAHGQVTEPFWLYIEKLGERCPLDGAIEDGRFGPPCSVKLMKDVGIDDNTIDRCVETTWEDKLLEQRSQPAWSPRAVRINGWRYSGMLDPALVARAICAGFAAEPEECKQLQSPLRHANPDDMTREAARLGEKLEVATKQVNDLAESERSEYRNMDAHFGAIEDALNRIEADLRLRASERETNSASVSNPAQPAPQLAPQVTQPTDSNDDNSNDETRPSVAGELIGWVNSSWWIGWVLFTLVAFGALLLYKRYLHKEMRMNLKDEVISELRNAMGEYRQMQG